MNTSQEPAPRYYEMQADVLLFLTRAQEQLEGGNAHPMVQYALLTGQMEGMLSWIKRNKLTIDKHPDWVRLMQPPCPECNSRTENREINKKIISHCPTCEKPISLDLEQTTHAKTKKT